MADSAGNKFFDVTHPGKSAAEASSRPVIVSNRPIMEDPMMRTTEQSKIREHAKEQVAPTGNDMSVPNDLPVNQQSPSEPVSISLDDPAVEQLTEDKTYFVHIKRAKKGRFLRHIALIIGLVGMAAIGYYSVLLLQQ